MNECEKNSIKTVETTTEEVITKTTAVNCRARRED